MADIESQSKDATERESTEIESSDALDPSDEKLLEEAKDFLKLAEEAESEIRRLALEDITFSSGDQWEPDRKSVV